MSSAKLIYPALYQSSDEGSNKTQRTFLYLIMAEYFLLFLVASLGVSREYFTQWYLVSAFFLVILIVLLASKYLGKYDQKWYQCRSLAESIKTSTWRYSMRAHPFDDTDDIKIPKENFRDFLSEILKTNSSIGSSLSTNESGGEQITNSMDKFRALKLKDRKKKYLELRLKEQREWYVMKAQKNEAYLKKWMFFGFFIYVLAFFSLFSEQILPFPTLQVTDLFLLIAASIVGWLQIKKYGELSASYKLTAHEIGIIKSKIESIQTENDFSDFVNESEFAFSREHTQWAARKDPS